MDKNSINLNELLNKKCIAIVGNGGNLLDKCCGEIIDNHDVVVRFNNYETNDKLKQYTGLKTDIWVTTFYVDIKQREDTYKVVLCPLPLYTDYGKKRYKRKQDLIGKFNPIFIPEEFFIKLRSYVDNPSCGCAFLFWMYSLDLLKNCSVFGFSFFKGKHHYYDEFNRYGHSGGKEQILYEKMINGEL